MALQNKDSQISPAGIWEKIFETFNSNDSDTIINLLESIDQQERTYLISQTDSEDLKRLIEKLPSDYAANLIESLPEVLSAAILEDVSSEEAADIIENMEGDVGADLLRELDEATSESLLADISDPDEASKLRELCSYSWDTAGGLMTTAYASFPISFTVKDVAEELSNHADKYSEMDVQYTYIVDGTGILKGVLQLRDLLLTPKNKAVSEIMIPDPISVSVDYDFKTLYKLFQERSFLGYPVVDSENKLKGVVTKQAVWEAASEHQVDDYLSASGIVGGEEIRSMPMLIRSSRRLAWLVPNIFLNLVAASVIAAYEDTLQAIIALAVFLPIISDMSGCSGNQAVAVSNRELTLGLIKPNEFLRIIWKEGILGLINGSILGVLLGALAALWKDNIWLGVVVSSALMVNTMLSVLLGGAVPLMMKKLKVDPALASGPILTTCTDMCGFFIVLSMAQMLMSKLI